jgi:hypothetical protein
MVLWPGKSFQSIFASAAPASTRWIDPDGWQSKKKFSVMESPYAREFGKSTELSRFHKTLG